MAADSQDEYGQTPLSYAASKGHEVVVKLLRQKIRDVSYALQNRIENALSYSNILLNTSVLICLFQDYPSLREHLFFIYHRSCPIIP